MVIPITGVSTSLLTANGSVVTCLWRVITPMYGYIGVEHDGYRCL